MFAMLQRIPGQVSWTNFTPGATFPLQSPAGEDSGLRCRAPLGTYYPADVSPKRSLNSPSVKHRWAIVESPSGKRLACMPAVPQIDDALLREFESVDALLFDGTFWSNDELIRIQGSGQTAKQMGHVPISGPEGSLRKSRNSAIHVKSIYISTTRIPC